MTGSGDDGVLLDALPDGVVVAGADQRVTHVNAVARRLLREADGVGRPLADVVALQDNEGHEWFACLDPYGGLGTRTALAEQSWFSADGTELLVTARLQRARPGAAVERVVVSLRGARSRQRLDRERSDLVATVAHELRSPLTGVKGFTGTLLSKWDRLTDAQKMLMLETVNADADRLTRLIAELLDVARIDTGRLSLHPRPMDVAAVTTRVLDSVRAGTGRTIDLEHDLGVGLPQVLADPDRFTQVLTNLVENAVIHGEGRVVVSLRPLADGEAVAPGVALVVDDEGEGIAPSIRRRVFTKFWKHGTRGGSGLGMYIAHGLTTAHAGEVEIGDSPAGGARITVRWPAWAAD